MKYIIQGKKATYRIKKPKYTSVYQNLWNIQDKPFLNWQKLPWMLKIKVISIGIPVIFPDVDW